MIKKMYMRFLFWKWDREHNAAVKRMRGCEHKRTMFVNVGAVHEKCRDCWALLVHIRNADGEEIGWTPNCADPRRSIEVAPPNRGQQ